MHTYHAQDNCKLINVHHTQEIVKFTQKPQYVQETQSTQYTQLATLVVVVSQAPLRKRACGLRRASGWWLI